MTTRLPGRTPAAPRNDASPSRHKIIPVDNPPTGRQNQRAQARSAS